MLAFNSFRSIYTGLYAPWCYARCAAEWRLGRRRVFISSWRENGGGLIIMKPFGLRSFGCMTRVGCHHIIYDEAFSHLSSSATRWRFMTRKTQSLERRMEIFNLCSKYQNESYKSSVWISVVEKPYRYYGNRFSLISKVESSLKETHWAYFATDRFESWDCWLSDIAYRNHDFVSLFFFVKKRNDEKRDRGDHWPNDSRTRRLRFPTILGFPIPGREDLMSICGYPLILWNGSNTLLYWKRKTL